VQFLYNITHRNIGIKIVERLISIDYLLDSLFSCSTERILMHDGGAMQENHYLHYVIIKAPLMGTILIQTHLAA
jgi:hypothetical protein